MFVCLQNVKITTNGFAITMAYGRKGHFAALVVFTQKSQQHSCLKFYFLKQNSFRNKLA